MFIQTLTMTCKQSLDKFRMFDQCLACKLVHGTSVPCADFVMTVTGFSLYMFMQIIIKCRASVVLR